MKPFTLMVPGIFTIPDDGGGWAYRAAAWMENNRIGSADHYGYLSLALRFFQNRHIKAVGELLERRASGPYSSLNAASHSNGTVLVLEALRRNRKLRLKNLHLVGSAAPTDCAENGINELIEREQIEHVFLYVSPKDGALLGAKISAPILGLFGRAYGSLGRDGPKNMSSETYKRTTIYRRKNCGHSQWLTGGRGGFFTDTMISIARAA